MKAYKYIALATLPLLFSTCSYDDSSIRQELEDFTARIEKLQSEIETLNSQLADLSALTSGNVITAITPDDNGSYVITYKDASDNEYSVVVAAMSQMVNVPMLGVEKDEDGIYWWTVTYTDGTTTPLTTADGSRVPVSGWSPTVSVNTDGYWTVDGTVLKDGNGNPIVANDGESCVFQEVGQNSNGDLVLVLGNGETVTIPVQEVLNLTLSAAVNTSVSKDATEMAITYEVTGTNAGDALVAIAEANSVGASMDRDNKTVTVTFPSGFTSGYLIMLAYDMAGHTVLRPVFFTGASSDVIEISTASELVKFASDVNAGTGAENMKAVLTNDIDMSGVSWTPIGNGTFTGVTSGTEHASSYTGAAFKGTFDGQGHSILNLSLQHTQEDGETIWGLFGILDGASVSNLTIGAASRDTSTLEVSAIAEFDTGVIAAVCFSSTITDCVNYAPISALGSTVSKRLTAGMIGFVYGDGENVSKVENLVNYGKISGVYGSNTTNGANSVQVAGIAGFCDSKIASGERNLLNQCINRGDIEASVARASGICAACNRSAEIRDCINYGNQLNTCDFSGGGRAGNITCIMGNWCVLADCENRGDLIVTNAKTQLGGLVCLLNANDVVVTGGGNYGRIIGDLTTYRGLLVANFSKFASVNGLEAGGSIGSYNSGDYQMVELNTENYMSFIGKYSATNAAKISDIRFNGEDPAAEEPVTANLSILFIGNSFTKDAVEHLPGMLAAAGITDVYMVHMYYGGRTVPEYNSGFEYTSDYHTYTCKPGETSWTDVLGKSIKTMVSSHAWDIVTIQEHTGRNEAWTWSDTEKEAFNGLITKINDILDTDPEYYYIMSQAYYNMDKIGSAQKQYITFSTQAEMYETIVDFTKSMMAEISFKDVIATGTMLQNLRTSSLDNDMNLTRDGYHMDYGISRYGAACTVFEKLISPKYNNYDLSGNTYRYSVTNTESGSYSTAVTDENAPFALQAARYAIENPYSVTDMSGFSVN